MPYASSTDTVFSGVSETMRLPAKRSSTLALNVELGFAERKAARARPDVAACGKPAIA